VTITTSVFMEFDGNNVGKQFLCKRCLMGIRARFISIYNGGFIVS
jgi:hypothetical protein